MSHDMVAVVIPAVATVAVALIKSIQEIAIVWIKRRRKKNK